MNEFAEVLVSDKRHECIPEELDYWQPILGSWDFNWTVHPNSEKERHAKGEWIFSRVINGMAIQDLFICPSRNEIAMGAKPDEFGSVLRVFDPKHRCWEIFYASNNEITRLRAHYENDEIILTEVTEGKMKWIFSNITDHSFLWRNVRQDINQNWNVIAIAEATRKND